MKKCLFVCLALAGLGMTQTASAVTQVWFTAAPSLTPGGASVVTQGLPTGAAPDLRCNVTAPGTRCEWIITVNALNGANDANILAWSLDFGSPSGGGPTAKNRVKSFTVNTATWSANSAPGAPGPAGAGPDNLWVGSRGAAGPPGVPGAMVLGTFILSKTKAAIPPGAGQPWIVTTNVGANEWGCNPNAALPGGPVCQSNGGLPMVKLGGNAAGLGEDGFTGGTLAVITGTNVPEPATLSLIGLGILGLLRRRK